MSIYWDQVSKQQDLTDDCLERALDWLYAHDPTQLFAGIAKQAHKIFDVSARQNPCEYDTRLRSVRAMRPTSSRRAKQTWSRSRLATRAIIGEDLKQWMLALATTGRRHPSVFAIPRRKQQWHSDVGVGGGSPAEQALHTPDSDPSFFLADSGVYSEAKMRWISRVPETSTEAKVVVEAELAERSGTTPKMGSSLVHANDDAATRARALGDCTHQPGQKYAPRRRSSGRWRRLSTSGSKSFWHLSNQHFACEADAQRALARELKGLPVWLEVQSEFVSAEQYTGRGRPCKDAVPAKQWHIQATVTVKQPNVEQETRRKAYFIVAQCPGLSRPLRATNFLDSAVLPSKKW